MSTVAARAATAAPLLLEQHLERIAAVEDKLHAMIALDESAAQRGARAAESEWRAGGSRGPLHGVALVVKDNIDVAGGLATTAGSTALLANRPVGDAPAVAALRRAGVVPLGKANLSEWANFRATRSTSGWSAVGGLTANPYALDRSAGGSSSGSAAAVAAGYAPLALGTETDGSIICPAALCGCVGLKPTVGLVSTAGVVPIGHSQDSVGPIARSVRLAAAALDAMAGGGHLEAISAGAGGLRVGVVRGSTWGHHESVDAICEAAVATLASAGAAVVEGVELHEPEGLAGDELTVMLHEFRAGIAGYLSAHPGAGCASLSELIEHHAGEPAELAHFGQELFVLAEQTAGLEDATYQAALARCRRAGREDGIDGALQAAGVDVLALPAYGPAWKSDLVNGDPGNLYGSTRLAAVAGYPVVTVPAGLVAGLPVGLALLGSANCEKALLRLAAALEDRLGPLPPPTFRPAAPG